MLGFLNKIFDTNARELKKLEPVVAQINSFEKSLTKLKDKEFPAKTAEFKKRLRDSESIEDLLPEAFATVREAIRR